MAFVVSSPYVNALPGQFLLFLAGSVFGLQGVLYVSTGM